MNRFESHLVKTLNDFFAKEFITAFAHRVHKANRFSTQFCDVLVDSKDPRFYLAIECKSTEEGTLYFSKFHTRKNGTHQLDTLREFAERTGRKGFVAVELVKPRKQVYFVPLTYVYHAWRHNKKGLDAIDIRANGVPLKEYIR